MKVFMSWSGQRSKLTAELLHDWIKCVIQASQPWISSKGIERGALWFSEINNELKDTTVGIICLTQENKNAPWILFEAGALAKGLSTNRVCTFLIDLKGADLQPPLAQFNHTFFEEESMWSLVTTLNNGLEGNRLDLSVLRRVFDTYWPQFQSDFAAILEENPPNTVVPPRDDRDILAEILDTTRSMANRVRVLEKRVQLAPALRWQSGDGAFPSGPGSVLTPPSDNDNNEWGRLVDLAANHLRAGLSKEEAFDQLRNDAKVSLAIAKKAVDIANLLGNSGAKV